MDVGGGVAFSDTVTGLSLGRADADAGGASGGRVLRARAVAFIRVGRDAVEPAGVDRPGGPVVGRFGADALWSNQVAYVMGSHQMYGSGGQVAAEVGYGLAGGPPASWARRASG